MGFFDKWAEMGDKLHEHAEEIDRQAAERWNGYQNTENSSAMYGGAVKIALMNLINTSDLDEVFNECAPEHSKRLARIELQTSSILENLDAKSKYDELAGRYNELQKHYEELQKNYQDLVHSLAKAPSDSNNKNSRY